MGRGWSLNQALNTPLSKKRHPDDGGSLAALVRDCGIVSYGVAQYRVRQGWSVEWAVRIPKGTTGRPPNAEK